MNIWIRLLINWIVNCSIRVIPIRNRIHSVNIPYEPNNNWKFKRVKNIDKASALKVFLNLSTFQPEINLFLNFYIDTYSTNKVLLSYVGGPFRLKSYIFWSLSLFANIVCLYVRKMTHYSVQPNNSVNILLKNPDIRIKRIIRLKPWIVNDGKHHIQCGKIWIHCILWYFGSHF